MMIGRRAAFSLRPPSISRSLHVTRRHATNSGGRSEEPINVSLDPVKRSEEASSSQSMSLSVSGTIDLVLVSFLWGTYNPGIFMHCSNKLIKPHQIDPHTHSDEADL